MVYQTPNRNYYVPDDGEDAPADGVNGPLDDVDNSENWGDIIQTTLDLIDEDMESALGMSAADVGAIPDEVGAVVASHIAANVVGTAEIDGSGGTSGQILSTDGSEAGVSWVDPPSGDGTARTDEEIEDVVGALVEGGTDIGVTYDDAAGTLTIDYSGTGDGTARTDEEIQDVVAGLLAEGSGISLAYDDPNNTLTISATGGGLDSTAMPDLTADSANTWWVLTTAGSSTAGETQGSGGVSIWDGANDDELAVFREGVPGDVILHANLQVRENALTVAGNDVLTTADEGDGNGLNADLWDGRDAVESATAPDTANYSEGDWWAQPQ